MRKSTRIAVTALAGVAAWLITGAVLLSAQLHIMAETNRALYETAADWVHDAADVFFAQLEARFPDASSDDADVLAAYMRETDVDSGAVSLYSPLGEPLLEEHTDPVVAALVRREAIRAFAMAARMRNLDQHRAANWVPGNIDLGERPAVAFFRVLDSGEFIAGYGRVLDDTRAQALALRGRTRLAFTLAFVGMGGVFLLLSAALYRLVGGRAMHENGATAVLYELPEREALSEPAPVVPAAPRPEPALDDVAFVEDRVPAAARGPLPPLPNTAPQFLERDSALQCAPLALAVWAADLPGAEGVRPNAVSVTVAVDRATLEPPLRSVLSAMASHGPVALELRLVPGGAEACWRTDADMPAPEAVGDLAQDARRHGGGARWYSEAGKGGVLIVRLPAGATQETSYAVVQDP